VLEHIQLPSDFLRSVRHVIGNRLDMVVFFEVPNALYTIKDLGIWDLIYEHCNYFTSNSLIGLFTSCGFKVMESKEVFKGQFLCIEAKPVKNKTDIKVDHEVEVERISGYVKAFAVNHIKTVDGWHSKMNTFEQKGQKVVIWGAGSKGITFLNMMKKRGQIEYLVDISLRKQGKYVPGSGQEIISPEDLKRYRPDIVIVMNPVYLEEIQEMINQMNLTSQLISVQS
jgi:hypothetical protein